jgi:spore coat polysaccharide biosynthesis protein SpsF
MGSQVFHWSSLEQSSRMTQQPLDREHVTLHMRNHPELFRPMYITAPRSINWPELGLTLDERDDYLLLKKIVEHFGEDREHFSCGEVVQLLRANREWLEINQHVKRKGNT